MKIEISTSGRPDLTGPSDIIGIQKSLEQLKDLKLEKIVEFEVFPDVPASSYTERVDARGRVDVIDSPRVIARFSLRGYSIPIAERDKDMLQSLAFDVNIAVNKIVSHYRKLIEMKLAKLLSAAAQYDPEKGDGKD